MTDISKEAVDALAGQCENHISEMTGLSGMSSLEADTLRALRAALDEAEARAVKAEAALKDIDANLTCFVERKPQQMMHPETVEFVRDMSRAHLGAKP